MTAGFERQIGNRAAELPRPASPAGRRVPILMYHEIADEPICTARLAVPPRDFATQLGYLRGAGYETLRAADLEPAMAEGEDTLPDRPVVLTFDDGFADFYDAALPAMLGHSFTATLYVTTSWLTGGGTGPGAGRAGQAGRRGMLSWSQVAEVAAAGFEIGAHTVHHPQLDELSASSVRQELLGSKHLLEDRLGVPVTGLSYPFGYSNQQVREAAVAAGYRYACAVDNRRAVAEDDKFALPRLTMGRATSLEGFRRTVDGDRLPREFLAYRMMSRGWSVVRRARSGRTRNSR